MGATPWEKARLEKIPISPQQTAADMIKIYPVNIRIPLSGKWMFEKSNQPLVKGPLIFSTTCRFVHVALFGLAGKAVLGYG